MSCVKCVKIMHSAFYISGLKLGWINLHIWIKRVTFFRSCGSHQYKLYFLIILKALPLLTWHSHFNHLVSNVQLVKCLLLGSEWLTQHYNCLFDSNSGYTLLLRSCPSMVLIASEVKSSRNCLI